jgi:replicative DNA helicase
MTTQELIAPRDTAAEWAVIADMLRRPDCITEVVGAPLEVADFSSPDARLVFGTIVEQHFTGGTVDTLVVGDAIRRRLSEFWHVEEHDVGHALERRVRDATLTSNVLDHANIVKQLATKRKLLDVAADALSAISEGKLTPEEIGDRLASEAVLATVGTVRRSELRSWMDCGREYAWQLQRMMKARREGREIGVFTGLPFIDNHTRGIGPGELCFIASEPGAGKTALAWACAAGFATRQVRQPEPRLGTLVLSMEMNLYASTMRIVQNITGIDGIRLREGAISDTEYKQFLREWKNREDLPLHWNFAAHFRLSQMRALVAEAIRKFNVGLVVVDHFRMLDTDRHYQNSNDADEVKVRFLKENVAKDMNVAVLCLAHTSKIRERGSENARPRLADLRGSGMISAFADQVALIFSPHKYMSEKQRIEKMVDPTDMQIDWAKNRFGSSTVDEYTFLADIMSVKPRY